MWVLTFLLLGVLVVGLIPVVVYLIGRFAAIGWRRGNQVFDDWHKQNQERELEDDGEESKTEGP